MNALIVVAFRDPYRAAEVLNELRRREWDWAADLDQAMVVRRDHKAKLKAQFSVDPTTGEGAAWAGLWASFLRLVLFVPVTEGIIDAVEHVAVASGIIASLAERVTVPDARWWKESLHISDQFIRDVGALIQPGDSALFLRTPKLVEAMRQLRNYGGTALHTALAVDQDNELGLVLASR